MNKVIFCRGIQGSGKSTWAKAWVAEDPERRIRINWDDMRNMMGPYWIPSREKLIAHISSELLIAAIGSNYDVVIDNMNLSVKSMSCFTEAIMALETAMGLKVVVEYKDFKTPLEECIARDAKRERPIGAGIITSTYEKHKDFYAE